MKKSIKDLSRWQDFESCSPFEGHNIIILHKNHWRILSNVIKILSSASNWPKGRGQLKIFRSRKKYDNFHIYFYNWKGWGKQTGLLSAKIRTFIHLK